MQSHAAPQQISVGTEPQDASSDILKVLETVTRFMLVTTYRSGMQDRFGMPNFEALAVDTGHVTQPSTRALPPFLGMRTLTALYPRYHGTSRIVRKGSQITIRRLCTAI